MTKFVSYVPDEAIEKDAQALLAEYAHARGVTIEAPIAIDDIIEKHLKIGIEFDDTHRLFGVPRSGIGFDPDILGAIFFEQKRIVIDESLDPDANPAKEGRYRYTAAHEVGHWRLHRHLFGKDPAQTSMLDGNAPPSVICRTSQAKARIELPADLYASCVLMPRKLVFAAWDEAFPDRLEAARRTREATRDKLAAASLARLNAPDPETFRDDARFALDALPALTTRPDQIKALRQTILNLAVRGKLVPQDAKDEPASGLLKRIAKERAKLLKAGYPNPDEARTQIKKLAEQVVPEGLEALPTGWAWATLLQCSALVIDCKNKTAPYASSGIRLIRTTNVRDGRMNLNDQKYVDQKTYQIWSARCTPEPGDILITREAPMGEVCLIPPGEQICLGQRMMLARLVPDTIDSNFMIYSLRDPRLMDRVQDKPIGATVQHLRVGGVETLLVPLPPLAEQHRIVAKVDALMALCDRLEASLAATAVTRRRLLDALLAEALAPSEDRDAFFDASPDAKPVPTFAGDASEAAE